MAKRHWALFVDKVTFGKEAFRTLGVMHVDVEENPKWADVETSKAITVYYRKFIDADSVRTQLDLSNGELTIILNESQRIRIKPQEILRTINGQDDVDEVLLYEV